MPRIPVRVEPYSSPSRQHRHYKNKRDQVLRALGKASYINGSHFAIMWVSARGDVETYASEALQPRLESWFVESGVVEEAKELVKSSSGAQLSTALFEDSEEDNDGPDGEDDPFLDTPLDDTSIRKSKDKGKALAPLNTAIANESFLRTLRSDAPQSAPLFPTSSPLLTTKLFPSRPLSTPTPPLFPLTLPSSASRTAFLLLRFTQLQQSVCKTVAKAWIKIIEPKKQTRCPYNRGESGKPAWWPASVRHKEPDHLMKPERHQLLLTILRSERVKVGRLQLATAEVVALIKGRDKMALLMDVYRVAREEEKLREHGVEGGEEREEEVRVEVSTLDGWDTDLSRPKKVEEGRVRSVSPEETKAESKKRSAPMTRSSTTTGAPAAKKRRSLAVPAPPSNPNLVGLGLLAPAPFPQRSLSMSAASSSTWPQHTFSELPTLPPTPLTSIDPALNQQFYYPAPNTYYDPSSQVPFPPGALEGWNFDLDMAAMPDLSWQSSSAGGASGETSFELDSPGSSLRLSGLQGVDKGQDYSQLQQGGGFWLPQQHEWQQFQQQHFQHHQDVALQQQHHQLSQQST